MLLFWVDNCIFYSKIAQSFNYLILSLEDSFLLEREEDMTGTIGLQADCSQQGTITLNQAGLTDRVLDMMQLADSNLKFTIENHLYTYI